VLDAERHPAVAGVAGLFGEQIVIFDVSGEYQKWSLYRQKADIRLQRNIGRYGPVTDMALRRGKCRDVPEALALRRV
jgi:hypothetical protein